VIVCNLTNDLICLAGDTRRLGDRRVLRQTNVHIRDVEVVAGKELSMELSDEERARRQDDG
jgi:hypothetical protein